MLQAYAGYYNKIRTHRSLDKDASALRPVQRIGDITSHPILGGFIILTFEFRFSVHTGNIAFERTHSETERASLKVDQRNAMRRASSGIANLAIAKNVIVAR
jgi:hypothetical protein